MQDILSASQQQEIETGLLSLSREVVDIYAKAELSVVQMRYIRTFLEENLPIKEGSEKEDILLMANVLSNTEINQQNKLVASFSEKETRNITQAISKGIDVRHKVVPGIEVGRLKYLRGLIEEYEQSAIVKEEHDKDEYVMAYSDPEEKEPIVPADIEILEIPKEAEEQIEAPAREEKEHIAEEIKIDIQKEPEPERESDIPDKFIEFSEAQSSKQLYLLFNNNELQPKDIPQALTYVKPQLLNKEVIQLCLRRNHESYKAIPSIYKDEENTLYVLNEMKNSKYLKKLSFGANLPNGKFAPPQPHVLKKVLSEVIDSIPQHLNSEKIKEAVEEIKHYYQRDNADMRLEDTAKKEEIKTKEESEKTQENEAEQENGKKPEKSKGIAADKTPARAEFTYTKEVDSRPLPIRIFDAVKRFLYNAVAFVHNIFAKDKMPYASQFVREAVSQMEAQRVAAKQQEFTDMKKDQILMNKSLSDSQKMEKLAQLAFETDRIIECELADKSILRFAPDGKEMNIFLGRLVTGQDQAVVRKFEFVELFHKKELAKGKTDMDRIINRVHTLSHRKIKDEKKPETILPKYDKIQEMPKGKQAVMVLKNAEHYLIVDSAHKSVVEIEPQTGKQIPSEITFDTYKDSEYTKVDISKLTIEESLPYYKYRMLQQDIKSDIFLNHENNNILLLEKADNIVKCSLCYTQYHESKAVDVKIPITAENLEQMAREAGGEYISTSDCEKRDILQSNSAIEEKNTEEEVLDRSYGDERGQDMEQEISDRLVEEMESRILEMESPEQDI